MIKIVDFGESFLQQNTPHTLHTPLPVRAPEVIFRDFLDYVEHLWSLGCMVRKAAAFWTWLLVADF
jgi:serine/threonine protein kinase